MSILAAMMVAYLNERSRALRGQLGARGLELRAGGKKVASAGESVGETKAVALRYGEDAVGELVAFGPVDFLALDEAAGQLAALLMARQPELAIALDKHMQQLKEEEPVCDWAGIYLLYDDVLFLTAYRGAPTPHPIIPRSKGICGAAVEENRTLNIEDVTRDPRYLSCDIRARSELVVPIRNRAGQPIGEVDIDSHQLNAFDARLVRKVEELAERIAAQMC